MNVVNLDKLDSDIANRVAIISNEFPSIEHALDCAYLAIRRVLRESNSRLKLASSIFKFVFYINSIRTYVLGSIDDHFAMTRDIIIRGYLREIIAKLSPEADVDAYIEYVSGYLVAQYDHIRNDRSSNYTIEWGGEKPIYSIKHTPLDVVEGANMLGLRDENITLDKTSLHYITGYIRTLMPILAKTIKTRAASSNDIEKDLLIVIFDL